MGRIGQAVARRARAFGLQIHYHNRKQVAPEIEQELEATYWDSLDQMLARMDIVSINCPHTPATFHLLSARRLKLMKSTAYIVNTARGEVIDENTLALMLEKGQLSGAGLDVFENEPAVNPKLLKATECGAAAAYGFGHHRGPHRHGRESDRQHPLLRGWPQAAGPGDTGDALIIADATSGAYSSVALKSSTIFSKRALGLQFIVDIAAGHGPAMQRALIELALECAVPVAQTASRVLTCSGVAVESSTAWPK